MPATVIVLTLLFKRWHDKTAPLDQSTGISVKKLLMRLLRTVIGLLLLPVCVAASMAAVSILRTVSPASFASVPRPAWALLCGLWLWLTVWVCLPKPVRAYVLAHELTHAFWGILTGERVIAMKVGEKSGSVLLSGSNILITLAPYFFPLYTILVIATYHLLGLFLAVQTYEIFWLALIGLTWGFHATFTISALLEKQPDIAIYGRMLSYSLIYLLNILGIGLWIVLVTSANMRQFGSALLASSKTVFLFLLRTCSGG